MAEMDLNTNQGQIRYLTPLDISTKTERSIVDLKDLVLSTLIKGSRLFAEIYK